MATIWDKQSGVVVPIDAGLSAEITQNGELVSQEVIYPMLSQQMGFPPWIEFRAQRGLRNGIHVP
jgi:hypothetical protein